jgi:6-phospho-beta-glucosidase
MTKRKLTIIGAGVRTPLLIHGLAKSRELLSLGEVALFDTDFDRMETVARLGAEIVRSLGADFRITRHRELAPAAADAQFIINSIRVGGIAARARDERLAIEYGLTGQETTGPGGLAMALRTIPVILDQARVVERVSPRAWFLNFTNPAGLIAQALTGHTRLRVIGICDTPAELFHRIAGALDATPGETECDYAGLNHLGWVHRVMLRGTDVTADLLADDARLSRVYPRSLFEPEMVRALRLLPSEYLFFYYRQRVAYRNQLKVGTNRGEEIERLNQRLFEQLAAQDAAAGLETYRLYLRQRNASYMKLETEGGSAFRLPEEECDPFEAATGYHRIALDAIEGLIQGTRRPVVLNVPNRGAIEDLDPEDIVEVPCDLTPEGPSPRCAGRLPESVRGLVLAVKAYERTAVRAAVEGTARLAVLAMLEYPLVGQWDLARDLLDQLVRSDPANLGYLR